MRIGELARQVGVNPKTVRYYERIGLFPSPDRTSAGYRIYDESDRERLRFIKAAQRLGMRLDEIGEVLALREANQRPCDYVREVLHKHVLDIDDRLAELQRLRGQLVDLEDRAEQLAAETESSSVTCPVIDHARRQGEASP